jgi:VanZ family protein
MLWKTSAICWAALIFNLSTSTYGPSFSASLLGRMLAHLHMTLSPCSLQTVHQLIRKLAHVGEYAVFSTLIYGSSARPQPFAWRPRRAMGCFLIAAFYSLTDEFHQSFVPGRTAALGDCGIDSLGGTLGMLNYYLVGLMTHYKTLRKPVGGFARL